MANLANSLTVLRIAATPALVLLMLAGFYHASYWALALYAVLAASDWLDGWVARRYGQQSDFGRVMDPIADKILVVAMFIALAANHVVSGLWLALPIVVMIREFFVAGLREFLGGRGIAIHVTGLAKWKTAVQMLSLGFLVLGRDQPNAAVLGLLLLMVAAVMTVMTGWAYWTSAKVHLNSTRPPPA